MCTNKLVHMQGVMPDVSGRQENLAGSGCHVPSLVQVHVIVKLVNRPSVQIKVI